MQKISLLLGFLFLFTATQAQKKPLDHSVYDNWQSISNPMLSKDGTWVVYGLSPQEGDAKLNLTNAKGETLRSIDRGTDARFTSNNEHLIYLIQAPFKEIRAAKIKKKKGDDLPSDSLGIYSLKDQKIIKRAAVKSYKLAQQNDSYLAFLTRVKPDTSIQDTLAKKATKSKEKVSHTLIIRTLASGEERKFSDVQEYDFSKNGEALYFVKNPSDSLSKEAGLYVYAPKTHELKHIQAGKGSYKNITFDEAGKQLAYTAYTGPEKASIKPFQLYYYDGSADTATMLANQQDLREKWTISEHGKVQFSENGEKLYVGIAPIAPTKDTTLVDFETAELDIWHWQEDYLQPQQLVNLKQALTKSYQSVIYPRAAEPRIIPLADEDLPSTRMSERGNAEFVLAITDVGQRVATQWQTGAYQTIYLVSTIDGKRTKIAEHVRGPVSLSPEGKYVLWFDRADSNWYSYSIKSAQTSNITHELSIPFYNEDNDVPDDANAYGIAGWSEQDEQVFLYDKYDIWSYNLEKKSAKNITQGKGREENVTYRYINLDTNSSSPRAGNSPAISLKSWMYLSVFDHVSKENGIAQVIPSAGKVKTLVKGPFTYKQIKATENLKSFLYTKENYVQSPNLFISTDFKQEIQLSDSNPWQKNYAWGTAELIHWTTPKGHKAEGILYKPEDFDPAKKYPMIAYFYEILSNGLYSYIPPTPTPSRLNISYFVSNGYLVFAPDIRYTEGYPGKAAEEYVDSGVDYLLENEFVDAARIGIQGQSWGGYQVAHLITRSNRYAAAWSGAPVVNMTSAYGGIRWQSGMSRQFQYEKTQSRIGKTLWEDLDLYIENSPLFHFPKVNTPVVIMANDADGAVPWYQGIEMFTALRRLQKPVWLLNYNGDAHNLVQRKNKKDIQIREQQFFDHYLKGKPAPVWMERGVPATLKGIDWGLELVD